MNQNNHDIKRCPWAGDFDLAITYHDKEWGVPLHDDDKLFEFIILEGMQAGLSWNTILSKRENFRKAFDNFDAERIVHYSAKKVDELLTNAGIIRNRLKINSVITNARCYLALKEQQPNFSDFIWQFVDGSPIINHWQSHEDIPVSTKISDDMSRQLKKLGFKFIGPTICYAFMQATGMVNDHLVDCFRHNLNKDTP